MNRPNIFKLTLISAAFGAMAVAGAGTALADAPQIHAAPAPAVFPFVDFDDVIEQPFENAERNFENFGDRVERRFEVFD
ncbi:hypothetical protein [Mycolicibacterium gadium]|jgi:glycerate kinase|uniref:Uncharacterized protein n=1 Tax=Mycolicibacterium gadium TaxID=1794 RepID=A0ABT6GVX9_MYCGU|nr:hypothetical protein [Mycolicibacterium gadium]MDG5485210.1 hypothetical protein [Mycolicibacterium gadium]